MVECMIFGCKNRPEFRVGREFICKEHQLEVEAAYEAFLQDKAEGRHLEPLD